LTGLERAFREEWSAIVAALARRIGLQAAEDAAAEAFAAAARAWGEGMPPNPGGWLMLTARRKAVDQLRRDRSVSVDPELLEAEAEPSGGVAGDDRLAMIFACCHPAFALPVRVAMTLRYVGARCAGRGQHRAAARTAPSRAGRRGGGNPGPFGIKNYGDCRSGREPAVGRAWTTLTVPGRGSACC
jgi:hypothetical protein